MSNSVQSAHPRFLNTGEEGGSTSNSVQIAHPHFFNTGEEGGSTSNSVQIAHPTFLHTVQAGRTEHSTRYLLHFCSFPSFTKCRPKKLSISYETSMKKLIPSGRPRMSCQDGANRKCISHERSHGFWSSRCAISSKIGRITADIPRKPTAFTLRVILRILRSSAPLRLRATKSLVFLRVLETPPGPSL